MRKIKFRQYLGNGKWHYWGFVKIGWVGPMLFPSIEYAAKHSQQYTGLKDKNGRDIFEGDVCRVLFTDWPSKSGDDKRTLKQYLLDISELKVVQWDFNGFYFSNKIGGYSEDMNVGNHGFIEVIGNIYENPPTTGEKGEV